MNNLQLPLQNQDYERSVLSALMIVEDSYIQVSDIITEADFYAPQNQIIFRVVKRIFESQLPVDVVTVHDELVRTKQLASAGGESYLSVISNTAGTLYNIVRYAQRIKQLSVQRKIKSVLENGHSDINDSDDDIDFKVGNIVSNLLQVTDDNNDQNQGPQSISLSIEGFLNHQQDMIKGILPTSQKTGFFDLDIMAPIQNGNLVVLAARPGMGKTTLAMNTLANIVKGHRVLDSDGKVISQKAGVIFSLEMTEAEITQKFIAAEAGVDLKRMKSGKMNEDEWASVQRTIVMITDNYPLFIDDKFAVSYQYMRSHLLKMKSKGHEIGVVVIDYLQIMGGRDSNNMTNSIGMITGSLKALAKEFDCPIILLSQLSRDVESRPNKRPVNSDLRDSGTIEQDADIILFVYRDEYYNENSEHKGITEVIIGKNRHGEIGTVRLGFEGQYSRFSNFMNAYNENPEYEYE